jgi:hypothetical protein
LYTINWMLGCDLISAVEIRIRIGPYPGEQK